MQRLTATLVLIGLVTTVTLVACGPAATPEPAALANGTPVPPTPAPIPPTTKPTGFPMILTDDLGREVTISALPQRIVSLVPSNTEILFAVGAGKQVVGVTEYCDYPPEAQTREKIGGFSAKTISVEKIVALEPDLVFSAGEIQQSVIEALEQAEIPVFALDSEGLEGVYNDIQTVGRLTGHEGEAAKVVAEMQARVAAVTEKSQRIPEDKRPAVFYEVWHEPLMTAGPTTFIGELIELAGGKNIFADVSEEYPQVSAETVVQRDPDVILGPDSHGEELTVEKIKARPGWEDISAVQKGRIYLVNGDIVSRSGPRLADALEIIARTLHPDLFQ
jgi:iron complex transport system substrate-binding protein